MYPAGFYPNKQGPVFAAEPDCVPVASVGALNPDGETIALFSNAGDWVSCHRIGVAVVSTMPTTFNASLQPTARLTVPGEGVRSTMDPDDYTGGFATWSGTSFAAPVLAGEIAKSLLSQGMLDDPDVSTAVNCGWQAVGGLVKLDRPSQA
jgi:subtilisin family serine protease